MDLQEQVDAKLKALQTAIDSIKSITPEWKVIDNKSFNFHNGEINYNVKNISKLTFLVTMVAFLLGLKDNIIAARKVLDIPDVMPIEHQGTPIDDWIDDIKLRIQLITQNNKLGILQCAYSQLNKYVSEESKIKELLMDAEILCPESKE